MRWMRVSSASEAEIRPARRTPPPLPLAAPRSEKVKKMRRPRQPGHTCLLGARELMGVLAVVGPLGTLISLWVLPSTSRIEESHLHHLRDEDVTARVIHLSLAHTDRKARFVLPEDAGWDQFVRGVQERLRLGGMSRIETSAGPRRTSMPRVPPVPRSHPHSTDPSRN